MKYKKILVVLLATICILLGLSHYFKIQDIKKINIKNTNEYENVCLNNLSTTQIPELYLSDEEEIEKQEIEDEAFKLQGDIAYESGQELQEKITLGNYAGLTYYSQIDSRWKNKLYTATGNLSQTIGLSGCGPTCAAMIVSSTKGTIAPDKMAEIFVNKGFRSANNGTYWSAFRWIADYFDIEYKETYKLDDVIELVKNNNLVVAACGNGLFTTGGHFIIIVGIEGDTLKIYDPYLYAGKFNISTRRGKATVVGNTVYVKIENFKKYANYNNFFAFKNIHTSGIENKTQVKTSTYTRYVKVNTTLNVRTGPGISYIYLKSLYNGEKVTVYEENGNWSRIDNNLWVCSDYLYEKAINQMGTVKVNTLLNVRTGPGTKYSNVKSLYNGNSITIYEEYNGWYRIGENQWVSDDYIIVNSSASLQTTVGKTKYFKATPTYIYSNANLTGTKYTYLGNTSVKILENLGSVDKIYVFATGRYGYVSTSVYR